MAAKEMQNWSLQAVDSLIYSVRLKLEPDFHELHFAEGFEYKRSDPNISTG